MTWNKNIKPNIPKLNKILNNLIYLISINYLILTIEYELPTIIMRYIRIIIGTQHQFNLQQITLYIFALLIFSQPMKFPSLSGMKELIK